MEQEPILKDIRRIRHEIEAECQNDPQKYYEHILQIQNQYGNRIVRFKPTLALKLARLEQRSLTSSHCSEIKPRGSGLHYSIFYHLAIEYKMTLYCLSGIRYIKRNM